jgi:hypothetical protein
MHNEGAPAAADKPDIEWSIDHGFGPGIYWRKFFFDSTMQTRETRAPKQAANFGAVS